MSIVVTWLVTAGFYIILAAGFVVIYKASRVLNFALGGAAMLLGYFALTVLAATGSGPFTLIIIVVVGVVLGFTVYQLFINPMTGEPIFATIVLTLGLGIVLEAISILAWRGYPRSASLGWNKVFILRSGIRLASTELTIILTAILLLIILLIFYRYSWIGRQIRAVAEKPLLAAQRGVNIRMVLAVSWAISTLIAGIAGIMFANNYTVSLQVPAVVTRAFAVALVGGLDSLGGLIPAALIISGLEVVITTYYEPRMAYVIPYIILLIVLIFRPWGFFGTEEEIERV